jgi:prepilin-type processing-associated H-X9-DG protein
LRTIGGTSRENWVYGDYSFAGVPGLLNLSGGSTGRGWVGSYNYRCQPSMIPGAYIADDQRDSYKGRGQKGYIPYVRPRLQWGTGNVATPGPGLGAMNPLFQSSKQLGDRALMSDSFNRWLEGASDLTGQKNNAEGMACHQEGYNVLYGDGSAQWFGDPQRKIIYWPCHNGPWPNGGSPIQPMGVGDESWEMASGRNEGGRAGYCEAGYWTPGGLSGNYWHADRNIYQWYPYQNGARTGYGSYAGQAIWHEFDVARGIDLPTKGTGPYYW